MLRVLDSSWAEYEFAVRVNREGLYAIDDVVVAESSVRPTVPVNHRYLPGRFSSAVAVQAEQLSERTL
jgi:hypothetical protein